MTYNQRFLSFEERFWQKVNKNGPVPDACPALGPCWLWLSAPRGIGYGGFYVGNGKTALAHRVSYELAKGPIPGGLDLDHLCRIRLCVRPEHLEPVTAQVNNLRGVGVASANVRKSACPQGHPYDKENTYAALGRRACRACHAATERRRKSERK